MACANCKSVILFGGKKAGSRKYCSQECLDSDELGRISDKVSEYQVDELVSEIRNSECPNCGHVGGLELFKSYSVYSIIVLTRWKENAGISCRSCATKRQAKDLIFSFFLGWWGIPFGIVVTPVIVIMNGVAMIGDRSTKPPSKEIKEWARLLIAHDILTDRNVEQTQK